LESRLINVDVGAHRPLVGFELESLVTVSLSHAAKTAGSVVVALPSSS